ncbi:MAG: hypothetical protein ACLFM8_09610 [Halobacteriales archaeon]
MPEANASRTPPSQSPTLVSHVHPVDLLLIVTVPVALLIVHLLPAGVRESFAFAYADPGLETALTATYVHLDTTHLINNLVVYVVILPTAYLLEVLSDRRRRFAVIFVAFAVGLAPVISYLNLAIARPGATLGFSVLNLAFLGYLAIAVGTYVDPTDGPASERALSTVAFLFGLAWVAVLMAQTTVTYLIATVSIGLGLSYVVARGGWTAHVRPALSRLRTIPGTLELTMFAVAVMVAIPVFSFATVTAPEGATVNRWGHLVGFALGFLVPFVTGGLLRTVGVRL